MSSGAPEQTDWLRRHARQSAGTGTTKVFVVTEAARPQVVAYYGWCMAQPSVASAPARLRNGAGRYPQPVALLARLGVDTGHEGRGLGAALLQDVMARLLELSDDIGCRGLLVHAESDEARAVYLNLVPEFERRHPMPDTSGPAPSELLDIPTVAEHLGVQPRHIRRLVHEKKIPTSSGGHLIRFDPADVTDWLAANRRPPNGLSDAAPRRG